MDVNVTLSRVSPIPLYHQLSAQLRAAISSGQLPKGAFLDNELELASKWEVSRPTVRRAIQDLVDDGLLVRRRGVGTQVVNDQVRRHVTMSSLYDDLEVNGRAPSTTVVSLDRAVASDDIAASLAVAVGAEVVSLVRLRLAGGRPLALMRNWLIVDAAGDLRRDELEQSGLYASLRSRGVRPHYAQQRISAAAATSDEAALLGVAVGAPLVTTRRVMSDDTGRPVEVGAHVYDAAHYAVEMAVVEN